MTLPELDDSTFYLHRDIIGTIPAYRHNRPSAPSLLTRILNYFFH